MGASKDLFIQDRENELYNFVDDNIQKINKVSEHLSENRLAFLSDNFVTAAQEFEDGNVSALDVSVDFKREIEALETQINMRKTWIEENKEAVENEAAKYPEGYRGFKVSLTTRTTLNFKNIEEWQRLENAKKEFEGRSKAALMMVQKGGLNVDADGAEIALPEISVSSFIKFDKLKK